MTKYKFLQKRYKSRTQSLYINGAGSSRRYRRTWGFVFNPYHGLRIGTTVGLYYIMHGVFGHGKSEISII